jgi:hypothetical protein
MEVGGLRILIITADQKKKQWGKMVNLIYFRGGIGKKKRKEWC